MAVRVQYIQVNNHGLNKVNAEKEVRLYIEIFAIQLQVRKKES